MRLNFLSVARAVIALARGLEMRILAEGVESAFQRAFLSELGCQAFQGFLFSKAVDAQAFEDWFSRASRLRAGSAEPI
jgi:EAL domain-containing protein (putative c-di-GMP-specific phosphodiesterase class I)